MHISLGDSLAGMFAVQGILAALYWRDALGGGRGQVVDVSLMEARFALLESTVPEYDRLGIVRGPGGTGLEGHRAVEHLQVERRQVDGDRGERRHRLPPALCGAMGRPELADDPTLRDPPRARREPGGDRGDRRRMGGAARRRRDRPRAQRGRRHLRADLHDRRHLRGPAVPRARDARRARGSRVRRVRRPRDRPEVLRDARRGALVGDLGGGQPQPRGLRRPARPLRRRARRACEEEGVL